MNVESTTTRKYYSFLLTTQKITVDAVLGNNEKSLRKKQRKNHGKS